MKTIDLHTATLKTMKAKRVLEKVEKYYSYFEKSTKRKPEVLRINAPDFEVLDNGIDPIEKRGPYRVVYRGVEFKF